MARPPATKAGDKQKSFLVVEGFIISDFDGNRKFGGDTIALTQKQAAHYQKMGAITFDMGAVFDEPSDDTSEGSSGTEADGGGEPPVRAPSRRSVTKAGDD